MQEQGISPVSSVSAGAPLFQENPSLSRVWQQVRGQGLATWTGAPGTLPLWFLGALPGWPQGGSY